MITIGNKEIRNLEEQVQKNQIDIAELKGTIFINGLGIRVLGQYQTYSQIQDLVPEQYGDAYLVGYTAPYILYVWTRANPDAAHYVDYWLNLGSIAIVGPRGPQGESIKGDTGDTGPGIYAYTSLPAILGFKKGDSILITSGLEVGNIYTKEEDDSTTWTLSGNIRGPQGIQGVSIKGDKGDPGEDSTVPGPKGDPGQFIVLVGDVDSVDDLPDPAILRHQEYAYRVGVDKDIYIQIGETPDTAQWENIGPLNIATFVTVNGSFVGEWNSDIKLDKKTDDGTYVYTHIGSSQSHQAMSGNADANSVALRTNGGQLRVANPAVNGDAIPLGYLNVENLPGNGIRTKSNTFPTTNEGVILLGKNNQVGSDNVVVIGNTNIGSAGKDGGIAVGRELTLIKNNLVIGSANNAKNDTVFELGTGDDESSVAFMNSVEIKRNHRKIRIPELVASAAPDAGDYDYAEHGDFVVIDPVDKTITMGGTTMDSDTFKEVVFDNKPYTLVNNYTLTSAASEIDFVTTDDNKAYDFDELYFILRTPTQDTAGGVIDIGLSSITFYLGTTNNYGLSYYITTAKTDLGNRYLLISGGIKVKEPMTELLPLHGGRYASAMDIAPMEMVYNYSENIFNKSKVKRMRISTSAGRTIPAGTTLKIYGKKR